MLINSPLTLLKHSLRIQSCNFSLYRPHLFFSFEPITFKQDSYRSNMTLNRNIVFIHCINELIEDPIVQEFYCKLCLIGRLILNESESLARSAMLKLRNAHMLDLACSSENLGKLFMGETIRKILNIDHTFVNLRLIYQNSLKRDSSLDQSIVSRKFKHFGLLKSFL